MKKEKMKKEKFNALIQTLIPLVLLLLFSLCIFLPTKIPFLQNRNKSSEGLGTVEFSVKASDNKSISFALKNVPSGTAPGGCTDIPGATVVLHPFLLSETEVTEGLWKTVIEYALSSGFVFGPLNVLVPDGENLPVTEVSWREAVVWCNALSAELGLKSVYFMDELFSVPVTSVPALAETGDTLFVDPLSPGFRLPSSAEWELAARYIDGTLWTPGGNPSGSDIIYHDLVNSADFAVFDADAKAEVKSRVSNALGLYDMSGNVWEWCYDPFEQEVLHKRVVRGGSWIGNAYRLQIGGAFGTESDVRERGQGFRIAKNK